MKRGEQKGNDIKEELSKDWVRVERPSLTQGAHPRVEVLWMNRPLERLL